MSLVSSVCGISLVFGIRQLPKVADEESLPFKCIYTLAHLGMRVFIQPESTHSSWNDVRNSVRRAGLQHVLLLSLTIANVGAGPFGSGRNKQSMQEAADSISESIKPEEFDTLIDMMIQDRGLLCDDGSLPTTPSDIPKLPIVANHMTFATCLI